MPTAKPSKKAAKQPSKKPLSKRPASKPQAPPRPQAAKREPEGFARFQEAMESAERYLAQERIHLIPLNSTESFKWDAYIRKCLSGFAAAPALTAAYGSPLLAMHALTVQGFAALKAECPKPKDPGYLFLLNLEARLREDLALRESYLAKGPDMGTAAVLLRQRGLLR